MEQRIRQGGRIGDIYRYLKSLRDHYTGPIRDKYPPIPRRVADGSSQANQTCSVQ